MKISELHPSQIPTSAKIVKQELWYFSWPAITALMKCFSCDVDGDAYLNYLIITANYFERTSRLVYKGSDGKYKKFPESRYKKEIFEAWTETPEEIADSMKQFGCEGLDFELIHRIIWQIADVVCPMMACMSEQAFVSEYAYAIDYVIRHGGTLPKPEIFSLFPVNYTDFNYFEGPLIEKIRAYNGI